MSLAESFLARASDHPDREAIVDARGRWSYADLARFAAGAADLLRTMPPSAPAAVLLECRGEYPGLYLGAVFAGRALAPLNTRLAYTELLESLVDSRAELVITQGAMSELARSLAASSPARPRVVSVEDIEPCHPPDSIETPSGDKSRVGLFYTSGRSGAPMGAVITLGNLASTVDALHKVSPMGEDDVFFAITPPWHVYTAVVSFLLPFAIGARTVVCCDPTPENMSELIRAERVTFAAGVPTLLSRLEAFEGEVDASSLRHVVSGGDVFAEDARRRFEARFGIPVIEGYGCTEATAAVCSNPFDADRRPGTVGRPLPNQHVLLVDDRGGVMPVGDVGEIIVRGPNVMAGYLGQPEETQLVLKDGWLHTGDLAWRDRYGFLHIVGRKKDMLIVDGLNVYPQHIEQVLLRLDGIAECAVIGVRHPKLGEVPKAVLVAEEGFRHSADILQAHCAHHLAEYKIPRSFVFVDELPKTTSGRISKATVRQVYGRSLD